MKIDVTDWSSTYYPVVMRSKCNINTVQAEFGSSEYWTIDADGRPDVWLFNSSDYMDDNATWYQCSECDLGTDDWCDEILKRHLERSN